ncbi:GIN domain-containing protein [Empedobacter brevis]|uniref:GIN domain-containing protein n=1 Tax=Empedobacter brevis TaxID=247 RepID=UPI0039B026A6
MKKTILLGILGLVATSCSSSIDGEGAATAQKEYTADNIKDLSVSCNCNLILVPGNTSGVKVESHQNIIDNLEVDAKNNSLTIKEKSNVDQYSAYDLYVYVTRDLEKIDVNKQTSMTTSGTLNVDELTMNAKDQARINQTFLITNNFDLKAEDQTNIMLEGTAGTMKVKAYGEAKLNLFKYEVNEANITTDDNALLDINARQTLYGSAKGNSIVNFMGDPNKDTKVADRAQVIKK